MITEDDIKKAWNEYYHFKEDYFGGPGNGCDDYRDIPDEVFKKRRELEEKVKKLQKEYDEFLKSSKTIIKKNSDGTYYITDLNGNYYKVHVKIGSHEQTIELKRDLTFGDIQDIQLQYGIKPINYDEIKEENTYVDNDVFKFRIDLKNSGTEKTIYTKPFPDFPLDEYKSAEQVQKFYDGQEDLVQEKYFTKERIQELKDYFCKLIQEDENPFYISCIDKDGGYNVTEKDLFNLD